MDLSSRRKIAAAGMSVAVTLGALLAVGDASAAHPARGRALYESRCDACHTTGVHVRESRKATDFAGIRMQVERWNTQLGGAWARDDIDDVAVYLNDRFYQYPCPDTVCRSGTARLGGAGGTSLVAGASGPSSGMRPHTE